MQKKVKKCVNLAASTKERIMLFSNVASDDKCLVGEEKDGEIKIFFKKKNNKDIENEIKYDRSSEMKKLSILYFMLCNLIYIIGIVVNYKLFKNIEVKTTTQIIIYISLSAIWFGLCKLSFNKSKYTNKFMLFIIIGMIADNVFIYLFKEILFIVVAKVTVIHIIYISCLVIHQFAVAFVQYIFLYKYEKNNIDVISKHSAEHMMCNYIEKYQTYAKNVEELKKCSRFTTKCGGMYGDRKFEKDLAQIIVNSIIIIMLIKYLIFFSMYEIPKNIPKTIPQLLVINIILLGDFIIIMWMTKFFALQISNVLVTVSQLITTMPKRNIKYKDLKMAQMLSKEFVEWQYPNAIDIEPEKKTE